MCCMTTNCVVVSDLGAPDENIEQRVMKNVFRVVLEVRPGVGASFAALERGSRAAHRALSTLGDGWLKRLQPLCNQRREDLDGTDYLDSSVIEYALFKALEAAYPERGGDPPEPLTRHSFVLRIVEDDPRATSSTRGEE